MPNRKILFVVPPKVHLLDINGPAHIFYEAREYGADLDLHFINLTGDDRVTSSAGLKFYGLEPYQSLELGPEDFIIVPGLYFPLLADKTFIDACQPFFEWLRKQNILNVNIGSVCTGTFLLAESGILKNKSCTTHWKRIKAFRKRYPAIDVQENRLFVVDKNIYTSAGISSGIDLALFILEEIYGTKLAVDVAKEAVIYFRRGQLDPQLSVFLQYRNHLEERVHLAQGYIQQNLGTQFNLTDVADNVNMSVRNLTRLFKKTTGITIRDYRERLRLEKAQKLLSEKVKIDLVAMECGFKSVSQLLSIIGKK